MFNEVISIVIVYKINSNLFRYRSSDSKHANVCTFCETKDIHI